MRLADARADVLRAAVDSIIAEATGGGGDDPSSLVPPFGPTGRVDDVMRTPDGARLLPPGGRPVLDFPAVNEEIATLRRVAATGIVTRADTPAATGPLPTPAASSSTPSWDRWGTPEQVQDVRNRFFTLTGRAVSDTELRSVLESSDRPIGNTGWDTYDRAIGRFLVTVPEVPSAGVASPGATVAAVNDAIAAAGGADAALSSTATALRTDAPSSGVGRVLVVLGVLLVVGVVGWRWWRSRHGGR